MKFAPTALAALAIALTAPAYAQDAAADTSAEAAA